MANNPTSRGDVRTSLHLRSAEHSPPRNMDQAEKIRDSLAKVEAFRHAGRASPLLEASVVRVKNLQSLRFRGTYADLAKNEQFAPATNFFLDKLYGEHDFASRDAQFCKVAGALERVLPGPAISPPAADSATATVWLPVQAHTSLDKAPPLQETSKLISWFS